MMALHARHHFRSCAYTDASKSADAVAGGWWEGVQANVNDKGNDDTRIMQALRRARGRQDAARDKGNVGRGLKGVRLPTFWTVYDAELYMIIERMRAVLFGDRDPRGFLGGFCSVALQTFYSVCTGFIATDLTLLSETSGKLLLSISRR